jgi:single-stranded DNA-binding protein
MLNINETTLSGKVVSDIELRHSKNGTPVVDFRLMYKSRRSTSTPVYIDVEAWAGEAERFVEKAQRGALIVVFGELRRDVWEKDGAKRSKIKITANRIIVDSNPSEIGSDAE